MASTPAESATPKGRDDAWPLPDDPEDEGPRWPEDAGAGDLTFRI